jgi:hypothetical protein
MEQAETNNCLAACHISLPLVILPCRLPHFLAACRIALPLAVLPCHIAVGKKGSNAAKE